MQIGDVCILYFRDDHAFSYALLDPRAQEISSPPSRPLWTNGDARMEDAWSLKGMGIASLVSIHFWRELIDFDYFDIGANYGLTTIPQAIFYKRCGRNNRVYAFEPGDVFPLLQASVRLNGIDDMTYCIRAAASDQSGEVEFHLTPAQSPASSLLSAAVKRPGVVGSRSIRVAACRLDEFVTQTRYTRGMVVKIDAEGADFRVLRGMQNIRETRLAVIQIEFYPVLVESYTDPEKELAALLHSYIVVDVGASPNRRIAPGGGSKLHRRRSQAADAGN